MDPELKAWFDTLTPEDQAWVRSIMQVDEQPEPEPTPEGEVTE